MKKTARKNDDGSPEADGSAGFSIRDQLRAFMTQMLGKQVPFFPEEALNVSEQAEDLVLRLMSFRRQRQRKVNQALKLIRLHPCGMNL